jgi:acyl-CoA synthetase (AMP-forming)/AMP-acid ligase II
VTVVVPAKVRVEQDGQAIFGVFGDEGGIYASTCTDYSLCDRNQGVTVRIVGTALMGAVSVVVNKRATPAKLLSQEEVETILRDVPAEPSTTAQELFEQVVGTAATELASAQKQHRTVLQTQGQLQAALVQHVTEGMTVAAQQHTTALQEQDAAEDQLRAALVQQMTRCLDSSQQQHVAAAHTQQQLQATLLQHFAQVASSQRLQPDPTNNLRPGEVPRAYPVQNRLAFGMAYGSLLRC